MTTNHIESTVATAATATSLGIGLAQIHEWLQVAVAVATLAWWLRIWLKNPNQAPPEIK